MDKIRGGKWRSFEEAREYVRSLGLRNLSEWLAWARSEERPGFIPANPSVIYKHREWVDTGDWLGIDIIYRHGGNWRSFEEAREFIQNLGLKNCKEWQAWSRSPARPRDIPSQPEVVYKKEGWRDFGDWLGTGRIACRKMIYARVVKWHRRRKLVRVERQVLIGKREAFQEQLKRAGLSSHINTSFVERVYLTMRRSIAGLVRRSWSQAQYPPELSDHLEWWRAYYHFVRPHESLRMTIAKPILSIGKRKAVRYLRRTPAEAVGIMQRRWIIKGVISLPMI